MTDEQILQLVKEYFTEEWCEEDGWGWVEFAGKPDVFLVFAREMYRRGKKEGYDLGYDDGDFNETRQL